MTETQAEYTTDDKTTILRKPHDRDHPYVVMDKTIFENPDISWKAKGLMGYLLSRPDDWQVIIGDLVNRSTDGKTAVRSALKELEQHGYLFRRTKRDEATGQWAGVDLIVTEHPLPENLRTSKEKPWQDGPPYAGLPHTENPPPVNPHTGNQTVLSTESLPSTDSTKKEPPTADSPPNPAQAFKERHANDVLGLMAESHHKRQEVEHPDFTDASKDQDPWADKPLRAFCVLVGEDYDTLKPSKREHWTKQLKKWADTWGAEAAGVPSPMPDETARCIQGITQSELNWMTFTSPFQSSFQDIMDRMYSRLRNHQPWDMGVQGNGGPSGPRIARDTVVVGAA